MHTQPSNPMLEVIRLIDQANKRLKRIQRQMVREAGLTPAQYFVLTLLWERDGRPFKELAAACNCTRATMTGIVDTLERKGLVARTPHPQDRRSRLVALTEAGYGLRDSTPSLARTFQGCCHGLGPDEARELGGLLEKLCATLEEGEP